MIKRIIFDIDNTLINWENEYYPKTVKQTCRDFNLEDKYDEILEIIVTTIDNYEDNYEYFKVDTMTDALNKNGKIIFSKEFVERILYYFSTCIPEKTDLEMIDTLNYLKSKYSLVALTNWFKLPQVKRLKDSNLLDYFDEVYATEDIKVKPNKEAFLCAISDNQPHECVMVGDNFKSDYMGAINCGLNAIFYNRKNIKTDSSIVSITKFSELKKLL